jgi:hypothetical protein
MENTPNMNNSYSRTGVERNSTGYGLLGNSNDSRERAHYRIQERIERERRRLAVFMAMAHGVVNLSLRSERNPRVRNVVQRQLQQKYGLKTPSWWFN